MTRRNAIIERFRAEQPTLDIADNLYNGDDEAELFTAKRDAFRAKPGNACHCTMANSARREFGIPAALFERTVAYLLEPLNDGTYGVFKYEHDGASVADSLDSDRVPVWNTRVRLRPPSRFRRVGAQTTAQKERRDRSRRGKQTAEHVAKRASGIKRATQVRRRRIVFDA